VIVTSEVTKAGGGGPRLAGSRTRHIRQSEHNCGVQKAACEGSRQKISSNNATHYASMPQLSRYQERIADGLSAMLEYLTFGSASALKMCA
jgi:hypothetical protein